MTEPVVPSALTSAGWITDQYGSSMKLVLRSWFWNTMLVAVLLVMASITTAVAVSGIGTGSLITTAIFGVAAVPVWYYTVRAAMLGVTVRSDGIAARGLGRTTVIPWEQMERVEVVGLINGAATLGGAITPVVYWKRPEDTETRRTDLSMLGGYVLGPRRPTRMERNGAVLQEQLSRWRERKHLKPV